MKRSSMLTVILLLRLSSPLLAQLNWTMGKSRDIENILPERRRAEVYWDYHDNFPHGLGLSAFHKAKLEQALDAKYRARLASAEKVCIGWYEARSPMELSLFRHLAGIGHDLIAEFFSNQVITPDVTTDDGVEWWYRDRVARLGLTAWFQPSVDIRRSAIRHCCAQKSFLKPNSAL